MPEDFCPICHGVPERPDIPECHGCSRCDFAGTLAGYSEAQKMEALANLAFDEMLEKMAKGLDDHSTGGGGFE